MRELKYHSQRSFFVIVMDCILFHQKAIKTVVPSSENPFVTLVCLKLTYVSHFGIQQYTDAYNSIAVGSGSITGKKTISASPRKKQAFNLMLCFDYFLFFHNLQGTEKRECRKVICLYAIQCREFSSSGFTMQKAVCSCCQLRGTERQQTEHFNSSIMACRFDMGTSLSLD